MMIVKTTVGTQPYCVWHSFILSYFPVEDYVDYDTDHEARPKTGEVDPYAGKCACTTAVYAHLWHNRHLLFQGTPGGGH